MQLRPVGVFVAFKLVGAEFGHGGLQRVAGGCWRPRRIATGRRRGPAAEWTRMSHAVHARGAGCRHHQRQLRAAGLSTAIGAGNSDRRQGYLGQFRSGRPGHAAYRAQSRVCRARTGASASATPAQEITATACGQAGGATTASSTTGGAGRTGFRPRAATPRRISVSDRPIRVEVRYCRTEARAFFRPADTPP